MQYILVCHTCGEQFRDEIPKYHCDNCRNQKKESSKATQIEKLLREGGYRTKDIAKKFDVGTSYVSHIKRKIGLANNFKELN